MKFEDLQYKQMSSQVLKDEQGVEIFAKERINWLNHAEEALSNAEIELLTEFHNQFVSYLNTPKRLLGFWSNINEETFTLYNNIFSFILKSNATDTWHIRNACNEILRNLLIFSANPQVQNTLKKKIHEIKNDDLLRLQSKQVFLEAVSGYLKLVNVVESLGVLFFLGKAVYDGLSLDMTQLVLDLGLIVGADQAGEFMWLNESNTQAFMKMLYENDVKREKYESWDATIPNIGIHEGKAYLKDLMKKGVEGFGGGINTENLKVKMQ